MKTCSIEKCNRKHYALNLCQNHYELNRRNGDPIKKRDILIKCAVSGCNGKITILSKSGLCKFHLRRAYKKIQFDRPVGNKGKNNPHWNGGTSEYPNHSLMKKVRLEVLKEANYICHFCGGIADRVHHIDKSKDNHSRENLRASCRKCNSRFSKSRTSKYKRLYGKTFIELQKSGFFLKNPYLFPYRDEIYQRLRVDL